MKIKGSINNKKSTPNRTLSVLLPSPLSLRLAPPFCDLTEVRAAQLPLLLRFATSILFIYLFMQFSVFLLQKLLRKIVVQLTWHMQCIWGVAQRQPQQQQRQRMPAATAIRRPLGNWQSLPGLSLRLRLRRRLRLCRKRV